MLILICVLVSLYLQVCFVVEESIKVIANDIDCKDSLKKEWQDQKSSILERNWNQTFVKDELGQQSRSTFSSSSPANKATFLAGSREWLFKEYDAWKATDSRVFWVTGSAGSGKTMFSRQLLSAHQTDFGGHFFFQHQSGAHRHVKDMIKTVAYQLACQGLSDGRELQNAIRDLKDKSTDQLTCDDLFEYYLEKPLQQHKLGDREVVVLIDALDEAVLSRSEKSISSLLASHMDKLPTQVCFVLTSRPEDMILEDLEDYKPRHLDTNHLENQKDVEKYIRTEIRSCVPLGFNTEQTEEVVQKLRAKCQGLFLYANKILAAYKNHKLTLEAIDSCPQEMSDFYLQQFHRCLQQEQEEKCMEGRVVSLLEVLESAFDPLTVDELAGVLDLDKTSLYQVLNVLGSLLDLDEKNGTVQFCHKSISDVIRKVSIGSTNDEEKSIKQALRDARKQKSGLSINLARGHEKIARACMQELECQPSLSQPDFLRLRVEGILLQKSHFALYAVEYAGQHLKECTDPELQRFMLSFFFLFVFFSSGKEL